MEKVIFPPEVLKLTGSALKETSGCSGARTYFSEKDGGVFVKTAGAGKLAAEAEMTRIFHARALSCEVFLYISASRDYLVTRRLPGRDCTDPELLARPARLCDALASSLRLLHEADFEVSGLPDKNKAFFSVAESGKDASAFDCGMARYLRLTTPKAVYEEILSYGDILRHDAVIHGDYCLPNIILRGDFSFGGFIDLGDSGIGDRHHDLISGLWSLQHNLKTEKYSGRFLDAYGRGRVDRDRLRLCGLMNALY